MKRVFSEPQPIFIHQLKDLLEEKGIACIIKNELLSGGVGELPPTEVWPELWIRDKVDQDPAERIVNDFLSSVKTESKIWTCRNCGENVEGSFNICWSCGSEAQDV